VAKIAVENGLDNVKQALQNSGHEVVSLNESSMKHCECCVISGLDQNMMGMSELATEGRVINARGMTAEEVVNEVNETLSKVKQ
jgi:hypothetical protein